MVIDLISLLVRTNFAVALAIAGVLILRRPVRHLFGPRRAYGIWLVAPLSVFGCLMPAARGAGPKSLLEASGQQVLNWMSKAPDIDGTLLTIWLSGVGLGVAMVAYRHSRFKADAEAGCAGPAVVGLLRPRLIIPADFNVLFTPGARVLVRAHERAHMDRGDALWNSVLVIFQCLFWFNPLVHTAAKALKLDQELACDAVVVERFPSERRAYAEALLKAQWRGSGSPLACHWGATSDHPLVLRLAALANRSCSAGRDGFWFAFLLTAWVGAFTAGWACQPSDRTLYRQPVQYFDYTKLQPPLASKAVWRIAIAPN
jgi:beta-lactamase regulating signal transducer with metallopeptidase domain